MLSWLKYAKCNYLSMILYRYYIFYIYVCLFKWWNWAALGLTWLSYQKHRKLRCCGIMEKIPFPIFSYFFFILYFLLFPTKKKWPIFFSPLAVRIHQQHQILKKKKNQGKKVIWTAHNFDPHFNNIFSCWKTET